MSESKRRCQQLAALAKACANGNVNAAKVLLDKAVPIDSKLNEDGGTALMYASKHGHANVVRMLLDKGAQVDITMQHGTNALMVASQCGHAGVVKLLLDKNAKVDAVDANGWTSLKIASTTGHTEVVKLLLDKGAQVDFWTPYVWTALATASENGHLDVVKLLLDKGAEVNLIMSDGVTALMLASKNGRSDIVKLLLDKGAQINSQNKNGRTALMIASESGHISVVRDLIKHGADIYLEGKDGVSALTITKSADIISLLLGSDDESEAENKESESKDKESKIEEPKYENDKSKSDPEESKESGSREAKSEYEDKIVTEERLLAAIEMAINEGGTIDHVLFHGVFLGPPRSGKDSLMKRLTGEMPSDTSPSTGAAEKVIHVKVEKSSTIVATITDNSVWIRLGYDEEAIRLMTTTSSKHTNIAQSESDLTEQGTDPSMLDESRSSKNEKQEKKLNTFQSGEVLERQSSPSQLTSSSEPAVIQQIMAQRKHKSPMEIFKEAMKSKGLEGLKKHLASTHSIYLTNTGGQMEFQEFLPLLVSGPSVFFVTFQLHKGITETFSVVYELPNGQSSKSYQSSLTVLEAILQTLSSIAAMGTYVYKGLQRKAVPLRPKVFIIGTHKDLLDQKSAKTEIENIDKHLQEVIRSTSHYREGIIQFASESQMIFAVNNHDPDDSDFQRIRSAVEHLVECGDYRMRSPAHWMIFSLVVRQLQNRVETYDKCYAIAKECGIRDKEEFNQALHFIHTKMGLIRYFPHEELQNIVVVDPQILFEKMTNLIVETFTFENVSSQMSMETFKKMGIFALSDLERSHNQSDQKLTPALFATLLKHLRIAAQFKQDGVVKFFLPCAVAHATEKHTTHSTEIPQMLVAFKCGYCPKGLPGSLITYLMTNEMQSEFEWELMTKQIYRNEVSFQVGPHDTITLRILPTHLEITCAPTSPSTQRTCCTEEQVCKEVRRSIDKGIKAITFAINYVDAQHSFTFYCTLDSCSKCPHPAKALEHKGKFGSLKCELKNQPVPLPKKYENWQLDSPSMGRLNKHHVLFLIYQLSICAAKWRQIGSYLGFHQEELNIIVARPSLQSGAPQSWLFTMLSEWMEWAPGDSRESKNYANLDDLKTAVSRAGFGVIASELSIPQGTASASDDSTITKLKDHRTLSYHFAAKKVITPHFLDEIKDLYFDSSGLEHRINEYDITVKIAEGSIPEGQTAHLKVGAALNGPFKSSSGKRPISPILWLCPEGELTLSKPIEIVLPHILTNVTTEDVQKFGIQVAKANHKDFVTSPDNHIHYIFNSFKVNEMRFESNTTGNYVAMKVTHCCFLCLEAYRQEQMDPTVAQAMAKRMGYCMHCIECLKSPYPSSPLKETIFFCASFFLEKCIKV